MLLTQGKVCLCILMVLGGVMNHPKQVPNKTLMVQLGNKPVGAKYPTYVARPRYKAIVNRGWIPPEYVSK